MKSFFQPMQKPSKLSIGQPHPDPIVETASLSAVQPPEPTYSLFIAEEMEKSGALSCLQLETIVYASQVRITLLSFASLFLFISSRVHSAYFMVVKARLGESLVGLMYAGVGNFSPQKLC